MKLSILTLTIFFLAAFSCKKADPAPDNPVQSYFPPINSNEWETISAESLGWNTEKTEDLLNLLGENGTRAFILLKDGKIVFEEYFGNNILLPTPFTKTSYWYWASAGKTLTSFTVGKAQEDGYLKIQDKTSDYLGQGWTSLTTAQESKITIWNQLTMTSGLDDGVPKSHSIAPEDLIFKAPAGERWSYHNGAYTLLEQVVASATNQDFEQYFNSVLRDKIGMDGFWQWLDDDHVYFSTPRSMARFGLLILNKGSWQETKIMSDGDFFNEMVNTSQQLNKSYGYLWWLNGKESFMLPETQIVFKGSYAPDAPADMISGIGKNGQYVCIIPSKNIVLVRMGENPESVQVPFVFLDDIWAQLNLIIK
jgi:CubicO group peptidase (beta-lactamase class C family)